MIAYPFPVHPFADKYRMLSEAKLQELADRIQASGQREPIVFSAGPASPGSLIDGRNRWQACQLAGVTPITREMSFATEDEIVEFIADANDHRRQMTEDELTQMREERRARIVSARENNESIRTIAEREGISKSQVARELSGVPRGTPEKIKGKDGKEYKTQRPVSSPAGEHEAPLPLSVSQDPSFIEESVEQAFIKNGPYHPVTLLPSEAPVSIAPREAPEAGAKVNEADELRAEVARLKEELAKATKKRGAILPSDRDDHNSPPDLIAIIRAFGDGVITLDPCHNSGSQVGASLTLTKEDDGLGQDWRAHIEEHIERSPEARELVYANPPYDQETLTALNIHANSQAGDWLEVITLVPLKGDQEWYQQAIYASAAAVCFISGRLHFWVDGKRQSGATFESILLYYGERPGEFCDCFREEIGVCLNLALYRQAIEAA